jgi:hypothetical protein
MYFPNKISDFGTTFQLRVGILLRRDCAKLKFESPPPKNDIIIIEHGIKVLLLYSAMSYDRKVFIYIESQFVKIIS